MEKTPKNVNAPPHSPPNGRVPGSKSHPQSDIPSSLMNVALDHMHEGAYLVDEHARFRFVNEESCRALGYGRDELLRLRVADIDPYYPMERWPDFWKELRKRGSLTFETRHKTRDNSIFPVEVTATYLEYEGSGYSLALARDITEQKRAEASLSRLNNTLRTLTRCNEALVQAQNEPDLLNDICRIIVEVGGHPLAWVGYSENDAVKSVRPVAHASHVNGYLEKIKITWDDTESGRGPAGTAIRLRKPSLVKDFLNDPDCTPWREAAAKYGYLSVLSIPLVSGPDILGALTVYASEPDAFHDMEVDLMVQLAGDLAYGIKSQRAEAERKSIEQALMKSEKNLAEAQSIAHLGSWEYDLDKDEEFRSEEFFRILGIPAGREGHAKDSVFDYIHSDDLHYVRQCITETLENGTPYDVEYRIFRADGVERNVHAQGKSLKNEAGRITKFIGTILDITERKRAEKASLKSKARFRALVEATTDWIWEVDENLVYVYASPKIRDLLGYEPVEIVGKKPLDFTHPHNLRIMSEKFRNAKDGRKPFSHFENTVIHKDGSLLTVETSGMPIFDESGKFRGFRGIDRDVSERKKLEEKYLQAQKMEAVGQLAGGIAHDFNNILTAIIGYNHLLLEIVEERKPRHFAEQVTKLADKASNLTRNLLAFSRKQTMHSAVMDLNMTLQNVENLLKRLMGEDIVFLSRPYEGLLTVMAVSGQIEQVLMNLATNARDAMPDGGTFSVSTDLVFIDGDFVQVNGCAKPGKYALVSVSDTGMGMDEKTKKRIFEPFFTTKEVGKGTGLGLATVYGIIKQHGGCINVYSEPGEGTTFRIYLPIHEKCIAEECSNSQSAPTGGSETILLAEDEPELREIIQSLLEGSGYRVIVAKDGEEALEKYVAHESEIDLCLLDVIMPKRNGSEVCDIISKVEPNAKIIFISGYTADIIERKGIPDTRHLISKPFSPNELLYILRRVLDEED